MTRGFSAKIVDLLTRLKYATESGTLSWEQTDQDGAFMAILQRQRILISTRDDDGQAPYLVTILGRDGRIIDVVDSEKMGLNGIFGDTYQVARRNVAGIDKVIDDLLDELPEVPSDPF